MIAYLLDEQYRTVARLDASPCCGEDFCDECADCLSCFGGDPCYPRATHRWIVYADQVDEWRTEHPEAATASPAP